jgi:hypothetical protein
VSNRAQNLLLRILNRIIDGPQCPNCSHDKMSHVEAGRCLGANYDKAGTHIGWCTCTSTRKKEKA